MYAFAWFIRSVCIRDTRGMDEDYEEEVEEISITNKRKRTSTVALR